MWSYIFLQYWHTQEIMLSSFIMIRDSSLRRTPRFSAIYACLNNGILSSSYVYYSKGTVWRAKNHCEFCKLNSVVIVLPFNSLRMKNETYKSIQTGFLWTPTSFKLTLVGLFKEQKSILCRPIIPACNLCLLLSL